MTYNVLSGSLSLYTATTATEPVCGRSIKCLLHGQFSGKPGITFYVTEHHDLFASMKLHCTSKQQMKIAINIRHMFAGQSAEKTSETITICSDCDCCLSMSEYLTAGK